jgi:hypothetical protein
LIKIAGNSYDVTPKMQEVRAYDFDKKKALYLEERLKDQKGWYKKKADQNVKSKNKWFYGILAAQGAGLLSTYLLVNCPNFPILLPSVFAAIAAAFVAWLQIKKHQELASTYGLAAKELSTIDAQTYEVDDKTKLAGFVADAENAMSREHAMWVVRRDHI